MEAALDLPANTTIAIIYLCDYYFTTCANANVLLDSSSSTVQCTCTVGKTKGYSLGKLIAIVAISYK